MNMMDLTVKHLVILSILDRSNGESMDTYELCSRMEAISGAKYKSGPMTVMIRNLANGGLVNYCFGTRITDEGRRVLGEVMRITP